MTECPDCGQPDTLILTTEGHACVNPGCARNTIADRDLCLGCSNVAAPNRDYCVRCALRRRYGHFFDA
jgi:hypothetical protein